MTTVIFPPALGWIIAAALCLDALARALGIFLDRYSLSLDKNIVALRLEARSLRDELRSYAALFPETDPTDDLPADMESGFEELFVRAQERSNQALAPKLTAGLMAARLVSPLQEASATDTLLEGLSAYNHPEWMGKDSPLTSQLLGAEPAAEESRGSLLHGPWRDEATGLSLEIEASENGPRLFAAESGQDWEPDALFRDHGLARRAGDALVRELVRVSCELREAATAPTAAAEQSPSPARAELVLPKISDVARNLAEAGAGMILAFGNCGSPLQQDAANRLRIAINAAAEIQMVRPGTELSKLLDGGDAR